MTCLVNPSPPPLIPIEIHRENDQCSTFEWMSFSSIVVCSTRLAFKNTATFMISLQKANKEQNRNDRQFYVSLLHLILDNF